MVCWSFLIPTGRSADEIYHAGAGIYLSEYQEWPGFKQLPVIFSRQATTLLGIVDEETEYPALDAAETIPRGERPAFADLQVEPTGINNLGQHPPLYYALLGAVHTVLPASTEFVTEIWVYRLVSALILTPLPLLAAALARLWGASRPIVLAAAWSVFAVPQLAVLGGAVNNDNLLTASAAWAFFGMALIARGDHRTRTALWTGLALAVALMSKAFGLLLLPTACLALLLGWRRTRRTATALRSAIVLLVTAMLGGWWWIYTYLAYGTLQPSGHLAALKDGPLPLADGILPTLEGLVTVVPVRFWAFLSVKGQDNAFPIGLSIALTAAFTILIVVMLLRRNNYSAGRLTAWAFTAPFVLTLAVLASQILRLYLKTGVVRGLNGRYLFFALLPVLVLVVLSLPPLVRGRERLVTWLVMSGGLVFSCWSAQRALAYHWGTSRGFEPEADLRGLVAWAAVPPAATVTVGLVAVIMAVVTVVATVRSLSASSSSRPADDGPEPLPVPENTVAQGQRSEPTDVPAAPRR